MSYESETREELIERIEELEEEVKYYSTDAEQKGDEVDDLEDEIRKQDKLIISLESVLISSI